MRNAAAKLKHRAGWINPAGRLSRAGIACSRDLAVGAMLGMVLAAGSVHAESPGLEEMAAKFLEGYEAISTEAADEAVLDLLETDGESAFRSDSRLGPWTRGMLLIKAREGELPRVRYRLRHGNALLPAPPAADPIKVSFVQVDRFNLGPALRKALAEGGPKRPLAPAEVFGQGPDVSWRLVTRPIMGQSAGLVAAGRQELEDPDTTCQGIPCLRPDPVSGALDSRDWSEPENLEADFTPSEPGTINGLPDPALAVDLAAIAAGAAEVKSSRFSWRGLESRESVEPGEPFLEIVMEYNLGQDRGVEVIVHDTHRMDHRVFDAWTRLRAVEAPGSEAAAMTVEQAVQRQPAPDNRD